MPTWFDLGAVFAAAFLVTFAATPLVRRYALARDLVVQPDERRVHQRPTAQLGGTAMMAGFVVALATAWATGGFAAIFSVHLQMLGLLAGAGIVWAVGTVDDVREMSAPAKTAGVVLGACVLFWSGINMQFFRIPFAGTIVLSADWAPLLTVLWVFGLCTAVNLIDGLDGLAAGIVAIAAGSFAAYGHKLLTSGLISTDNPSVLIAVIVVGLCLGFLPHNFHPARIFMGDSGSMLIGLVIAAAAIVVTGQIDPAVVTSRQTIPAYLPILLPIAVLLLPLLDMGLAVVRRVGAGRSPFHPDRMHLHHQLLALGHSHQRAVVIMYLWTAVFAFTAIALISLPTTTVLIVLGIAVVIASMLTLGPLRGRARIGHEEGTHP